MIVASIIFIAVSILFIILGLIIWLKKKINLIHDYHHQHVKEENTASYTRLIGIGMLIMGAGMMICGILLIILKSSIVYLVMASGFIIGIVVMIVAQKKYNGVIMD